MGDQRKASVGHHAGADALGRAKREREAGAKEEKERKRRKQRRRRKRGKHTLLNRIFNHGLSFSVASQSFTIAEERRRGRRIRGGEGKVEGEKLERGKKIRA